MNLEKLSMPLYYIEREREVKNRRSDRNND